MNKKVLDQIKKELLKQKTELTKELSGVEDSGTHKAKFPQYGDKPDENAQEISEYESNIASEKEFEGALRDIDSALKRIEDGTYGICKYCKKEINEKRLLARPVASSCVDCKEKLQQV